VRDVTAGPRSWAVLGALAVVLVYFHVFMEWLFHVTKPSLFSALGSFETALALATTPLPLALLAGAAVIALWAVARATASLSGAGAAFRLARGIPAFIGTCCVLILADNFTLTVFGFGIRHTGPLGRWAYALSSLALVVYLYRVTSRAVAGLDSRAGSRALLLAALTLLVASSAGVAVAWVASPADRSDDFAGAPRTQSLPNILLLGGDGLNAEHMSCYGYDRDTTPFLRELKKSALVFQNHFPNAGSSGASTASMLTGKLPTRLRLIYPPDILRGRDAYQHLPAILRRAGYRSVQISMRHYADAYDLNLRDSFDTANFREVGSHHFSALGRGLGVAFCSQTYFLGQVWERVEERLLHILGVKKMVDAFEEATAAKKDSYRDAQRIEGLLRFIDSSPEPFFAHLHLAGTHGKTFAPRHRVFSKDKEQDRQWMPDFYDDAILDFDADVEAIVEHLSMRGKLDRTVIVIHSDHGMRWATSARIPLLIRFPTGPRSTGAGLSANTQNLDLAPTLLDYLGMEIPEWMEGRSLISSRLERLQPIISVSSRQGAEWKDGWFEMPDWGAPFYSLKAVSVVLCHRSHWFELQGNTLLTSEVAGHTAPCSDAELPSPAEVRQLVIEHLRATGYDVTSLEEPGPLSTPTPESLSAAQDSQPAGASSVP